MKNNKTWAFRIAEAEDRGNWFTRDDKVCSSDWVTCAIGEKYGTLIQGAGHFDKQRMVETIGGNQLINLGFSFTHAVEDDDVAQAREIYAKIREFGKP